MDHHISNSLVGVLVDVSGSMRTSLQLDVKPTDQHLTRVKSIFSTIINIAEREVDRYDNKEIFVLAFGLKDVSTCDLLSLLEKTKTLDENNVIGYNPLIKLLGDNGAPYAGEYVKEHLTEREAGFLYDVYSKDIPKLRELVKELPSVCKDGLNDTVTGVKNLDPWAIISGFKVGFNGTATIVGKFLDPTGYTRKKEEEVARQHADRAIQEAKSMFRERYLLELRAMSRPKNKTLKSTIALLHKVAGTSLPSSSSKEKSFSAVQLTNLVSSIEPFIYGNTPMCEALRSALGMFNSNTHNDNVLFLLTDGEATDGRPVQFAQELRDEEVHVFVCLLTSENIPHPRRLYYEAEENWTQAQRDMFELSSTVENAHSAMWVLLEHGWELPASGKSRLFIQANHPDVVDEFSRLVRHMMESNEALLNIFGRVKLDEYITSSNSCFIEKKRKEKQEGGTCYAHAVATVLHLAMNRIEGREGGVPLFSNICKQLINQYGINGYSTKEVLSIWAPDNRLQYKEVDELGARQAINARRPVVATFRLYEEEWVAFEKFYKDNRQGILEKKDLYTHKSLTDLSGHAVVLIKIDPESLTFMNSWGTDFADKGFFKVRNQSVLDLKFYDVFWTLSDLKESEIKAFDQKRRKVGEDFVRELPVNIQNLPYECPRCNQSSPAIMFIGHLLEATCPKCEQNFNPTPLGFVLNLYTH